MRRVFVSLLMFALPGAALAQNTTPPAAPPAAVAEIDAAQLALARRFMAASSGETGFVQLAISGFLASARSSGVRLSDAQEAALRPVLAEEFAEAAHVFTEERAAYEARTSSAEDLNAGIAYYESEPGRRYARVAIDFTVALSIFDISHDTSTLPDVPAEGQLTPRQHELADQVVAAFGPRISELATARLEAAGLNSTEFVRIIARFMVSRLEPSDVEAAIAWARSPASIRLEGASAERSQAEQLAVLHAMRVVDRDAIRTSLQQILSETPT